MEQQSLDLDLQMNIKSTFRKLLLMILMLAWLPSSGSETACAQRRPVRVAVAAVADDEDDESEDDEEDDFEDEDFKNEEDDFEDEEEENVVVNRWGTTMPKMEGAKKFILEQDFLSEIDQVNQICELTAKQKTKLKIASRGAVKKQVKKWKTQAAQQFGNMGLANNMDDDDDDEDDKKKKKKKRAAKPVVYEKASEIDAQTMQLVSNMWGGSIIKESSTESAFWKKALRSTLTKEQLKTFNQHRQQQDDIRRAKVAEATVETLCYELRLTDEQKAAYSELVLPEVMQAKQNVAAMYEKHVLYYYATKASKSKVKKILSEAQFQKFEVMTNYSKQLGPMVEQQNVQVAGGMDEDTQLVSSLFFEVAGGLADVIEGFGNKVSDICSGIFAK